MYKIATSTLIFAAALVFAAAARTTSTQETTAMHTEGTYTRKDGLSVVAHRGGAKLGPENTLKCIRQGMNVGAEWIEIDVHLSADGKIVVCHDPSVDRTTDGSGFISAMNYAELRKLNIVDESGNATGEHLPTLDEVLECIKGKAKLLLEIKRSRHSLPGIETACVECIRRHGAESEVTIQSFDDEVLETVHGIAPEIRLEKLLFASTPWFDMDRLPYIASYNVFYLALTGNFVEKAHAKGREVKVWTLDSYNERIVGMVDGIITNDPRIFLQNSRKWNI